MGESRDEMFPLFITSEGCVVLYRMPGDEWKVAGPERDAKWLLGLSVAQRAARGIDVKLAKVRG